MWPWHVQHADDMPSCFAWEFDHDMSNMLMPHGSSTMTCPTCWWHMGVWPWHVQHAHDLQHAPHMGLWYHMLTFDDFCLSQAPYHGHNLIRKGQWAYGRLAGSRLSWWSGTVFQGTWATSFPPWRWIRICGLQTLARSKTCSGSTAIPSWQLRFW